MRLFMLASCVVLIMPDQANAVPNCSQVDESGFCAPLDCDSSEIHWRGSCDPPYTREWQCIWHNCRDPYGEIEYGPWTPCNCPGQGGNGCDCLLTGTLIALPNGQSRPVETTQVGDLILSFDTATGTTRPGRVLSVHPPISAETYYIINGRLKTTGNHPILVAGKWLSVNELKEGDYLTSSLGSRVLVRSIEIVEATVKTYNFRVDGGTYVAEGIVVHNKDDCENFVQFPEP
jgi:hypothetical protein